MILEPGFRDDDFKRLKQDAINFLKVSLREGNDEELGKERLYNIIYKGHPYQHHSMGTISGLESIRWKMSKILQTLLHAKQFGCRTFGRIR